MNDRLQQFLSAENINQAQFADNIGVARASVSHILAGRNKPGYDFILNMMKRYPDLNVEWLLTGVGKMYKSRSSDRNQADSSSYSPSAPELFDILHDNGGDAASDENPGSNSGTVPETVEHRRSFPSRESHIHVADTIPAKNIEASERKEEPEKPRNLTERQRTAIKVTVFYDDGTFQEFAK